MPETKEQKAQRAKDEGDEELAEAYLSTGMSEDEYNEAGVSGGTGFPVEGRWPIRFGLPFADKVGGEGNEWEVVQFPYTAAEGAPFAGYEDKWTVFPGVNPNSGKSQMKTTLTACGITPDAKGNFNPKDVEGKIVDGYFKRDIGTYYDPATDQEVPSKLVKLITILPHVETSEQSQQDLPF